MLKNRWAGVTHWEGKELLRIEGCHMYLLLYNGRMAAMIGHKTLTLVAMESKNDVEHVQAYMVVEKWLYPLTRHLSPVYITPFNSILMIDPWSNPKFPTFVAIVLPQCITMKQKKVLESYLEIFSYLQGKFTQQEESPPRDETIEQLCADYHERYPSDYSITDTYRRMSKLPCKNRLHLLKLYQTGAKDDTFINIQMTRNQVKIYFLLYNAITITVKQLQKYFDNNSQKGIVPIFDKRKLHYGEYEKKFDFNDNKVALPLVDNLKEAGKLFESRRGCMVFELIDYQWQKQQEQPLFAGNYLAGSLIKRFLFTKYEQSQSEMFCELFTLSEIETDREFKLETNPRILEDCEHALLPLYTK